MRKRVKDYSLINKSYLLNCIFDCKNSCLMTNNFQKLREKIPRYLEFKNYNRLLYWNLGQHNISRNQWKGLLREWRAYWFLKAKYKSDHIIISSADEDNHQIDLIRIRDRDITRYTYQVTGNQLKQFSTDYLLRVTETKIYMSKNAYGKLIL